MRFAGFSRALPYVVGAVVLLVMAPAALDAGSSTPDGKTKGCATDGGGLKLPAGFCATVFADGIGHARHLAIGSNGVVYVNTWSGDYYYFDKVHEGGFLVALQDKAGAGKADMVQRFGDTEKTGGAGGTGIGVYKGWVYAEINDRIVRYSLPAGAVRCRQWAEHNFQTLKHRLWQPLFGLSVTELRRARRHPRQSCSFLERRFSRRA